MSISDAEFAAWLRASDRQPCALTEIDYVAEDSGGPATQTVYLSWNAGRYISAASDTPASTPYRDRVIELPTYTRTLDRTKLGGRYSIAFGQYKIANADGALDAMLGYALDGSEVRQYYGDRRWPKADFRLIFTALGSTISAPDPKTIVFSIRDAGALLNRNIGGDELVGGTGGNTDRPVPMNFGLVRNPPFLLKDYATNTYTYGRAADSAAGLQFAGFVCDRAVDLTGTWTDNGDGTVTLAATADGQVSGDVLRTQRTISEDSYRASDFYRMLAGELGGLIASGFWYGAHSSFVNSDNQDFHLGYQVTDTENIRDILDKVAFSSNSFYATRRDNTFTYGRIFPFNPPGASVMDFVEDEIRPPSAIKVETLIPLYDQVLCFGNRNWFVGTDIASLVPIQDAEGYRRKGQYFTEDEPSGTSYVDNPGLYHQTMSKSPVFDTLISAGSDRQADIEMSLWAEVYRKRFLSWVRLIDISVGLRAYSLELGDVVTLTLPRYGLDSGPQMQVAGIAIRLSDGAVDLTLAFRQEGIGLDSRDNFLIQLTGDYVRQQEGSKIRIVN